MGVPKFFRYMSERYPCLSELVREEQIPDFDNLYLDMNGIIHPCSHPDDGNVHFRITEEAIFRAIFNYIDKLFFLIKPRKLFFMAVDGVAPRAKMNQQRSRRFRSAKEAEVLEQNALAKGEKLPDTARFDSNCITPGTVFMVRLQAALKYFVKQKMSTNPLWQRCRIILSGHETPGEGEHKIMEYIRYMKSQPGYDFNTRHCLYGLDADLIVLGLCTHEMHFSLLREEVSFGKKAKKASVEETRFFLLHLNLLREYLELEFGSLKNVENREFNINKIIDDWILMGFLVGNDFIPHLPNLHINTNALPKLYDVYKKVWPQMDGYLNDNGNLNLDNFEIFMEELSKQDLEMFSEMSSDLKYMEGKRGGNGMLEIPEAFDFNVNDMEEVDFDADLAKMIEESNKMFGSDDDLSDDEAMLEKEFLAHKRDYYITKLNYPEMSPQVLAEQTECYIRALQWILFYYYRGVSSWGWFYPHHYAPYISDVKNFQHLKLDFDMGKPFLPYEQLLAVLPAASRELLPGAFRDLMTHSDSEIIEYYPKEFQTDLNGKKQDWEAVVLIPFIDELKLLAAMSKRFPQLLPEEKDRNIHGPMLQYDYTPNTQGECDGVFSLKKIPNVYCTETAVFRDEIRVSSNFLEMQISKWPKRTCHLPGFPTMKHLNYTGSLQRARVKVFEQPSRNDTMILMPEKKIFGDLEQLASQYLDKIVYVGWPHLVKSKVTGLLTAERKWTVNGVEEAKKNLLDMHLRSIEEHTFQRMGIKFRETEILAYVKTLASVEYVVGNKGKMISTNIWSNSDISYPLQGVVMNIREEDDEAVETKIEDFYPVGTPVFMLSSPYFGCEGNILDPKLVYSCGRIQVNITVIPEPQLAEARQVHSQAEQCYYNTYDFSAKSGLPSNTIARITGCVFIIHGAERGELAENTPKTNVGLNLKSKKTDQQVAGYVRKKGTTWQYSEKTLHLIIAYYENFPEVFNLLSSNAGGNDEFYETTLFPPQTSEKKLSDITTWLKQQGHSNADRVPCNTKWVETEAVEVIKKAVDDLKNQPVKCIKLQVKPHFLLRHGLDIPQAFKSKSKIRLFDRVVVVKKTYQIPVGYKGTVIAIHPMSDPNPVRIECVKQVETFIEVVFDKELPNFGDDNDVELKRVARVAQNSVLVVYQPLDEQIIVPVENPIPRGQNLNNKNDMNRVNEIQRSTASTDRIKNENMPFFADNRNASQQWLPESKPNRQKSGDVRHSAHNSNISSVFVQPPPVPVQQILRNNAANFVCPPATPLQHNTVQSRTFTNSKNSNSGAISAPFVVPQSGRNGRNNPEPFGNITTGMGDLNLKQIPNVVESTETLRKLLGMTTFAPNNNPGPPSPLNQANSINFPKPPSNWTKDASTSSSSVQPKRKDMQHFLMPSVGQMQQQPIPLNNVQPIQPHNSSYLPTAPNMPLQVDMKYAASVPPHNYSSSNSKNDVQMCPSRQTRVNNISSGPSAFIPLQAMKSIRKQEKKCGNTMFNESSSENVSQENNLHSASTRETGGNQDKGQMANTSESRMDDTKTKSTQQKIRKPKIAANFNFKG